MKAACPLVPVVGRGIDSYMPNAAFEPLGLPLVLDLLACGHIQVNNVWVSPYKLKQARRCPLCPEGAPAGERFPG